MAFKISGLPMFYAYCPGRVCFLFNQFILRNN